MAWRSTRRTRRKILISTQFHTQIKVVVHAQTRWTRNASDMAGTPPCAARAFGAKYPNQATTTMKPSNQGAVKPLGGFGRETEPML